MYLRKGKYYFKDADIDFNAADLDLEGFLIGEYFKSGDDIKKEIYKFYRKKHGRRSLEYLKRKNSEWAEGDFHLTQLMRERITEVMPHFLSDDAKQKLGMNDFVCSIRSLVESHRWGKGKDSVERRINRYRWSSESGKQRELSSISKLTMFFEAEFDIINKKKNDYHFRYNILSEEEKRMAFEIGLYILLYKLKSLLKRVKNDLKHFSDLIALIGDVEFSLHYTVAEFEHQLEIRDIVESDLNFWDISFQLPMLTSEYSHYADLYLANELKSIRIQENESNIHDVRLTGKEINNFISQIDYLSNVDAETQFQGTFRGEGGIGQISLVIRSGIFLKKEFFSAFFKAIGEITYYGIIAFLCYLLFSFLKMEAVGYFLVFWIILVGLTEFRQNFYNLRNLYKEFRSNG